MVAQVASLAGDRGGGVSGRSHALPRKVSKMPKGEGLGRDRPLLLVAAARPVSEALPKRYLHLRLCSVPWSMTPLRGTTWGPPWDRLAFLPVHREWAPGKALQGGERQGWGGYLGAAPTPSCCSRRLPVCPLPPFFLSSSSRDAGGLSLQPQRCQCNAEEPGGGGEGRAMITRLPTQAFCRAQHVPVPTR